MYKFLRKQLFFNIDSELKATSLDQKFSSWNKKSDDNRFILDYSISENNKIYRYFTRDTFVIIYVNLKLESERLSVEIFTTIFGHLFLPFLFLLGSIYAFVRVKYQLAFMLLITSLIICLVFYLLFRYCFVQIKRDIERII